MACRPPEEQCKQRNAFFSSLILSFSSLFFGTIALLCPLCTVHLLAGSLPCRMFDLIHFCLVWCNTLQRHNFLDRHATSGVFLLLLHRLQMSLQNHKQACKLSDVVQTTGMGAKNLNMVHMEGGIVVTFSCLFIAS